MKRFIKYLLLVLCATTALSFASCSKDDDEPGKGESGIKSYNFISNGITYYYAIDWSDIMGSLWSFDPETDLNSGFDVRGNDYPEPLKNTILLEVVGRSWIPLSAEFLNPPSEGTKVSFSIYIDNFDYTSTNPGTKLSIKNVFSNSTDTETSYDILGNVGEYVDFSDQNPGFSDEIYHWHNGNPIGEITFISYEDNLLTLKFEGIKMWNDLNTTKTLSLDGTITFIKDNLIM